MAEIYDFPGMEVGGETDKERATRCMGRIIEILKEENCGIVPDFRITGAQISSGIIVVAKPYNVPATSPN